MIITNERGQDDVVSASPGERWQAEVDRLVGELLHARIEQGLTTYELAELALTQQSTISGTLGGRHKPLAYTLVRLADVLGLRVTLVPKNGTLESHGAESEVAAETTNPTGQLDGVDGVGLGDVSKHSYAARCAGDPGEGGLCACIGRAECYCRPG